ncbi:hypothetical protein [Dactylosporangium sp. CA-139066]|uniref:hypothetical protein n=1 Tax=Dactylosporangium sp. CA-139066 TaxID=3239930 RepID=UPI003D8D0D09
MKELIGRLVLPVICALLGLGVYWFGGIGDNSDVTCGGRVMRPADSCDHVTNGATRTNDYDQEKAEHARLSNGIKYAGLGIVGLSGLAVVYVGVSGGIRAARRKRAAA